MLTHRCNSTSSGGLTSATEMPPDTHLTASSLGYVSTASKQSASGRLTHRRIAGPSSATLLVSASYEQRLEELNTLYQTLTRRMEPLDYLIKLTEVNIADGHDYQALADERDEWSLFATRVEELQAEMTQTVGAGVEVGRLIKLERKIAYIAAFLDDLCLPPHCEQSLKDMLENMKQRRAHGKRSSRT